MTTLETAVTDTLNRLGDKENAIWSRDEIALHVQDGYDEFCRRSKCLFDIHVIENLPPTGNWQTDFEKYLALRHTGWGVTDEPFHITDESERNLGVAGQVGRTYHGPAGITNPGQVSFASTVDGGDGGVPTVVIGGTLPSNTVEVQRVTYDGGDLTGMTSMQMRQIDVNYETRTGDPSFFVFDKDGINFLRVVPAADGGASYDTVDGSWGTRTYTDDTDVTAVTVETDGRNTGGYGILVHQTGCFPALGPWGTPTRIHPSDNNIAVDIARLGRSLSDYPVEVPTAYEKYVIYYAMARALRRDGPGQDITLAEHYEQRFEMGLSRMFKRINQFAPERTGRFRPPNAESEFGIGDPQLPSNYPAAFGGQ